MKSSMKWKSTTLGKRWLAIVFVFFCVTSIAQPNIGKMPLVYQQEGMHTIKPVTITYRDTLQADVYRPVTQATPKNFPCVIFVSGFASINLRYMQAYIDWARLMAANGIIGVVYETNSPVLDFDNVIEYIDSHADELRIDTNNIGIWSCSGNSPLGVYKVNASDRFKCHSIYYGLTTTINSKYLDDAREMSKQGGFALVVDREYTSKTPTLIVRAGKDHWTLILQAIDEFVAELLKKNVPLELINYPEGQHAFDLLDDNDTSRDIILRTVEFFKSSLAAR